MHIYSYRNTGFSHSKLTFSKCYFIKEVNTLTSLADPGMIFRGRAIAARVCFPGKCLISCISCILTLLLNKILKVLKHSTLLLATFGGHVLNGPTLDPPVINILPSIIACIDIVVFILKRYLASAAFCSYNPG